MFLALLRAHFNVNSIVIYSVLPRSVTRALIRRNFEFSKEIRQAEREHITIPHPKLTL